jgi:hypothetical protein
MEDLQNIRIQLAKVLSWSHAHTSFKEAVTDVPYAYCHIKPQGLPYSIWDIIVHCRITQWDILQYSKNQDHQSPNWPEEYWPDKEKTPTEGQWKNVLQLYFEELNEMTNMIEDPATDLFKPFSNGSGHNLFREVLLLADHTAYHLGQIILIRRLLGIW